MSDAAPSFYFVYKPKEIRFSEAKKAISDACTCSFRSTRGPAFFARVTAGDIMAAADKEFENGAKLAIEPSRMMSEEIWSRRAPRTRGRRERPADDSEPRQPREPRAPRQQEPREPRPQQPRYYSLYVFSRDAATTSVEAVYDYILNTLAQPAVQFDKFERDTGDFGFVRFEDLEASRAARAAYDSQPLGEHVIVKPALPKGRRNFRRGPRPDAAPAPAPQ